jgi:hypothetical protein
MSAAFSPIMIDGALVLPEVSVVAAIAPEVPREADVRPILGQPARQYAVHWRASAIARCDRAELFAAQRADLMIDQGDHDGQLVWLLIKRAIVALRAPPRGKPH